MVSMLCTGIFTKITTEWQLSDIWVNKVLRCRQSSTDYYVYKPIYAHSKVLRCTQTWNFQHVSVTNHPHGDGSTMECVIPTCQSHMYKV